MRKNWDWFNFQAEYTDKDRKLKILVVHNGRNWNENCC